MREGNLGRLERGACALQSDREGRGVSLPYGSCCRFRGRLGREHLVSMCLAVPVELHVTPRAAGTPPYLRGAAAGQSGDCVRS